MPYFVIFGWEEGALLHWFVIILVSIGSSKKTFFNHFTRTRFTVDCDDIYREIFHGDDHVRKISSDIKIELLNISMIEQASMLLTRAHYQPLQRKLPPLHARWELLTTLVMHADEYYRMQLYDRVLRGFLSRSYGRLHQPSLDYSHESLILVATHRDSGELVGVTEIYPTKDTYLCNLAVHPSFRRRGDVAKLHYYLLYCEKLLLQLHYHVGHCNVGLATTLCCYCARIARFAWQSDMMTLHVERHNEEARQFYQSLGYSPVGGSNDLTLSSLLLGEAHLLHFRKPLIDIYPSHRPEK